MSRLEPKDDWDQDSADERGDLKSSNSVSNKTKKCPAGSVHLLFLALASTTAAEPCARENFLPYHSCWSRTCIWFVASIRGDSSIHPKLQLRLLSSLLFSGYRNLSYDPIHASLLAGPRKETKVLTPRQADATFEDLFTFSIGVNHSVVSAAKLARFLTKSTKTLRQRFHQNLPVCTQTYRVNANKSTRILR